MEDAVISATSVLKQLHALEQFRDVEMLQMWEKNQSVCLDELIVFPEDVNDEEVSNKNDAILRCLSYVAFLYDVETSALVFNLLKDIKTNK